MTITIGRMNSLRLVRTDDKGGFFDADGYGEVFLPRSQIPEDLKPDGSLSVFCYIDDGRLTITAKKPRVLLGELGRLKARDVTPGAAYMEWGIRKDLMVPFREQNPEFKLGEYYVVYVDIDNEGRLFGTSKFNRYFTDYLPEDADLRPGDRVTLMPVAKTPLGIRMVVNNSYFGMLPAHLAAHNDVHYGIKLKGFIQSVRPDRKINLSLYQGGQEGVISAGGFILAKLREAGGHLPYSDKSAPEDIERALGMSKGKFKKVIGALYKNRQILLDDNGITLIPDKS